MTRQRFWMGEPYGHSGDEFEVQADDDVLDYLETLDEVQRVYRFAKWRQATVWINRQWDIDEAWLRIYYALEDFVRTADADLSLWEQALDRGENV